MAELIADLFVSLDGFARGENAGPFFGYTGPDLSAWVSAAVNEPQVLLMGRVTYEAMSAISSVATDEASTQMTRQRKAVFSNTISEPLGWANTRLLRGELGPAIAALKQESAVPIRTIGSMALVNGMMRLGLVDRLRILTFPLTLGADGREPIYAGYPRAGFELVGSQVLDARLVLVEYRPAPAAPDGAPAGSGQQAPI
ncbi:MAG: dihydrofolate reductase family protein [Streptosporangiaceae bacterium]